MPSIILIFFKVLSTTIKLKSLLNVLGYAMIIVTKNMMVIFVLHL